MPDFERPSERVASVPVQKGLSVLRYISSRAEFAPGIYVRPSPRFEGAVSVVSSPGSSPGVLAKIGECVVIVAKKPGALQLTVSGEGGENELDANVALELLSNDSSRQVGNAAEQPQFASREPAANLSGSAAETRGQETESKSTVTGFLIAHIARRGDRVVEPGHWVAGPNDPSPIEGIEVSWNEEPGVTLEYQVLVASGRGRWSSWVFAGQFAGSRGRRWPLLGVRFRLGGDRAGDFQIKGEALFLGATVVPAAGRELEFISRSGSDPLVGLKLEILDADAIKPSVPVLAPKQAGRVRILRGSRAAKAVGARA